MNECLYHPQPKYRECHHVDDRYVAVWWDSGFGDWVSTSGRIGQRGSISGLAALELDYQLAALGLE